MTEGEWLQTIEAKIFDVITQSDSLQDLAEYAYTLLQNPIMISNDRGEILAMPRQNAPYHEPLWEEFARKGFIPRERRSQMSTVFFRDQMKNDTIVVLDKYVISHRLMVYQSQISDHFLFRGLLLESHRPFTKLDEQVFSLVVKAAIYQARDNSLVRNFHQNSFEYFLFELLHGRIESQSNEQELANYMGLEPGWQMTMLMVRVKPRSAMDAVLSEARTELESIFPDCISVVDQSQLLLFVRRASRLFDSLQAAEQYLRRNGLWACVSRIFDQLSFIPVYYRQLSSMMDLLQRTANCPTLTSFSVHSLSYLLSKLPPEEQQLLQDQRLQMLLTQDLNTGSELFLSLYAYAITTGSCAEAARLLGIHYNSMKLRLTQIRRIFGDDLERTLPTLYLSAQLFLQDHQELLSLCRSLEHHRWMSPEEEVDDE